MAGQREQAHIFTPTQPPMLPAREIGYSRQYLQMSERFVLTDCHLANPVAGNRFQEYQRWPQPNIFRLARLLQAGTDFVP